MNFRTLIEGFTDEVKPKWTPPKDTFAEKTPASETAKIVAKDAKDYKQAVDRVEFFFNRGGDKIPNAKARAEKIVAELKKIFNK